MQHRSFAGVMFILFCVGIFTFIYIQHQILVKEVESSIGKTSPIALTPAEEATKEAKPIHQVPKNSPTLVQ